MSRAGARMVQDRLTAESSVLVLVDVQGKLANLMWERDRLLRNLDILIRGCRLLGIPVIWMEHVPEKLGATVPEVAAALSGLSPLSKETFSCLDCPQFLEQLKGLDRATLLLAGIESHVCVYQTALDAMAHGYRAEVVEDAVSSRTRENRERGLRRMEAAGAGLSSVEMVLFELQRVAVGETFRALSRLVR